MSLSAAEINTLRDIQTKCVAIMTRHAPETAANVQKALDGPYKGREADLLKDLTLKYDTSPIKKTPPTFSALTVKLMTLMKASKAMKPSSKPGNASAEIADIKCVALMLKFAPDNVANVRKALDGPYKGREADLLKDLTLKYDPTTKVQPDDVPKQPPPPAKATPPTEADVAPETTDLAPPEEMASTKAVEEKCHQLIFNVLRMQKRV